LAIQLPSAALDLAAVLNRSAGGPAIDFTGTLKMLSTRSMVVTFFPLIFLTFTTGMAFPVKGFRQNQLNQKSAFHHKYFMEFTLVEIYAY
jgi:hypothetical protein